MDINFKLKFCSFGYLPQLSRIMFFLGMNSRLMYSGGHKLDQIFKLFTHFFLCLVSNNEKFPLISNRNPIIKSNSDQRIKVHPGASFEHNIYPKLHFSTCENVKIFNNFNFSQKQKHLLLCRIGPTIFKHKRSYSMLIFRKLFSP